MWTKTSDKAPEYAKWVICWKRGVVPFITNWPAGSLGVTHWMPIPKNPDEEAGITYCNECKKEKCCCE